MVLIIILQGEGAHYKKKKKMYLLDLVCTQQTCSVTSRWLHIERFVGIFL